MAGKPRFHFLLPETFEPRYLMRFGLRATLCTAAIVNSVLTASGGAAWRELQNKVCTLDLFLYASERSSFQAGNNSSLLESLKRVRRLDPHARIWTWEGLGYRYVLDKTAAPQDPLFGAQVEGMPVASLIPLHSGMGMALARRLLASFRHVATSNWPSLLNEFYGLCNLHGQEGYRAIGYESLGFTAQILHPELTDEIDRNLRAMDVRSLAHFWYGVGRAIYFAPSNLAPSRNSFGRAVEKVKHKARHPVARLNALAGLAFAATLVNIRNPEILECFVRHHARRFQEDEAEAFSDGVGSAAVAWLDITEDESCLTALSQHHPRGLLARAAEAWDCLVRCPIQRAGERHRTLKESNRLDELFRCSTPSGVKMIPPFAEQVAANNCQHKEKRQCGNSA